MTPTSQPAPSPLQGILNFLFGNKVLQNVAGPTNGQPNPGGSPNPLGNAVVNHFMQNSGGMVQSPQQSNSYLQPIIDSYMKQKQMQQMGAAAKKKKAAKPAVQAPQMDEDED